MIITILVMLLTLSIGGGIFLYVSLSRALNRIDLLESQLTTIEQLNTEYTQWVGDFRKLVGNVYKKLKSIDERGIFEKDDDVGFVFSDMLNIINECNKRIIDNDDNSNITNEAKNEK